MIEIIAACVSAGDTRVVLFNLDGTLSPIRPGWMYVTLPVMVEILPHQKTGETAASSIMWTS
jgi:hypothetical protein